MNENPDASVILKQLAKDKGTPKAQDKENSFKKQKGSLTRPRSRGSSSKNLERSSLNETLNASMCSVTATKIDKRNAKGETPLQTVSER